MTARKEPAQTVSFIDQYCSFYQDLFAADVRSYQYFKHLHLGLIAELPRKSLPALARAVGLEDGQELPHFLANSPWQAAHVKQRRLDLLKQRLRGREILLCIDETGDKKKGNTTDYVSRQYIGNLGKIENGIVSIIAYGVIDGMTFPLLFKVFKPKGRLKDGDKYRTKPELAVEIIEELQALGFKFSVVLADITTDKDRLPEESTWLVMTNLEGNIKKRVGNVYGLRTWIEYGFKQIKNELGWADYRLTEYTAIERWWKVVSSAYMMVSLQSEVLKEGRSKAAWQEDARKASGVEVKRFQEHKWWDEKKGWKNLLNNLRLIIQPYIFLPDQSVA